MISLIHTEQLFQNSHAGLLLKFQPNHQTYNRGSNYVRLDKTQALKRLSPCPINVGANIKMTKVSCVSACIGHLTPKRGAANGVAKIENSPCFKCRNRKLINAEIELTVKRLSRRKTNPISPDKIRMNPRKYLNLERVPFDQPKGVEYINLQKFEAMKHTALFLRSR